MVAIRIIPCLDVKDGKVVKGIHFEDIRVAGDPVENASFYYKEGADEIVFLDISATIEGRKTMVDIVKKVADVIFIPFTVGGGISSIDDIEKLLSNGADKVSINTAAVKNPNLIEQSAKKFGSQSIVVAIDAKRVGDNKWEVFIESGKTPTRLDVVEWAKRVVDLGAGEILLTSIDRDGTQEGYDVELTKTVSENVNIPIIASGGAGKLEHLYEVIVNGKASAVLIASLLHFRILTIPQIKKYLKENGIEVRESK
ncbi:MAG: imidazole glycerol phosphate synthase subunit HisF [Candidatus Omnitrophica bacterium]|nr:imidazole glycerol phosphate synthase subunit HisF [Candidatus Omnitrophota bacterium]MCM8802015.1 imidazole glycerol phosphate synthase subunit HisF [Candidatus Omnitrophota bacterium]